MANLKRDIRYTDRDFNSIKNQLIQYSKTYFPDTFNDFTETSTGMLFIEMAAYVGDVLSLYLDNQVQETFIQKARQNQNLYALAYSLGYVPKVTSTAFTMVDYFQQVPAIVNADGEYIPDYNYSLLIPENTQITANSNTNIKFLTEDVVDFSASSSLDPTTVSVYQVVNSLPSYFLLKKTRKATSATIKSTTFAFTNAIKFDTVNINDANIVGILDVTDTNGNTWYEVPNLAQENVYNSIRNTNTNDPNFINDPQVPYLLELKAVQRRFAARFIDSGSLQLQFGAGSTRSTTEEIIPNPDNVGLGLPFERTKLTTAFSPVNFVFTNTYGIAPYNTTLTVRYLTGGGAAANVEAGSLTGIDTTNVSFVNQPITSVSLTTTLANQIFNSLASNNALAADGGGDGDSIEELRQNALGNFQNQLRTVTAQDYLVRALSMPSNLGVIAKAHTQPQKIGNYSSGELPSVLDLYILTYNANRQLRTASLTLKRNLRTYLSEYRMINDSIDIKDAYIINIGVDFDIVVNPNFNNSETLTACIASLQDYFNINNWQINEPIILRNIFILLSKVPGVQIAKNIVINNLTGASLGYSDFAYDITGATVNDVIYPSIDPMVFEVKYPDQDILGRVVAI